MKFHLKHVRKGTPITVEIHKPHNGLETKRKHCRTMQVPTIRHTEKKRKSRPYPAKEILQPYEALPKSKGTADTTALPYM